MICSKGHHGYRFRIDSSPFLPLFAPPPRQPDTHTPAAFTRENQRQRVVHVFVDVCFRWVRVHTSVMHIIVTVFLSRGHVIERNEIIVRFVTETDPREINVMQLDKKKNLKKIKNPK